MKTLFNIDMHISIVHDVKNLLPEIGYEIDSCCMSGHTWVNKEKQGTTDVVNPSNWLGIDQKMCDEFYERYRNELSHYDGFIHSYPPAFAALFEKFEKPIYTIACTRYDYPCGSGESAAQDRLEWLNHKIIRGYKSGQITLIANNLYDKKYCEEFCGGEWKFIPSICTYIHDNKCTGETGSVVLWDRNNDGLRDDFLKHPKINNDFTMTRPYDRSKLSGLSGVVHIPYNISVMSSFEHYAMGIPMFVPSYDLLIKWKNEGRNVLSELEFVNNFNQPPKDEWIQLADWYDEENMPYIQLYDSIEHLSEILDSYNQEEITSKMREFYPRKKEKTLSLWKETLQ
jgi:hypothetical protein